MTTPQRYGAKARRPANSPVGTLPLLRSDGEHGAGPAKVRFALTRDLFTSLIIKPKVVEARSYERQKCCDNILRSSWLCRRLRSAHLGVDISLATKPAPVRRGGLCHSAKLTTRERGADERRNDNVTSTRSNCSRIHAGLTGITNSSADIYPLRPRHRFGNNHVRTLDLQCKCIGKRHAYFSADRHPINFRKPCVRRSIASKWALERKTSHNIHGRTHNRIHDCTRSVSRHDCRQLE